jgi:hypothetical protein
MALMRASEPAAMMLACRREWLAMTELVRDGSLEVSDRVAALGGAVKVRDQLLELLAIPRRPVAGAKATRQVDLATLSAFDLPEMPVAPGPDSPIP